MSFIKRGLSRIKEIGKFLKVGDVVKPLPFIKDGFYICSECGTELCKVSKKALSGVVTCKKCNTVFRYD